MPEKIIKIKTDEKNPVPMEITGEEIVKVSQAFQKIQDSKLTKRAIILLIHDALGGTVGKGNIEKILNITPKLVDIYTIPLLKKK